ncbi:MAG: chloride channel protein [Cytophagaceae bacterium]
MKQKIQTFLSLLPDRLIKWRISHISNKNFIILASIVVGITAGLAAILLKALVHRIELFADSFSDVKYHNYIYIFFPTLGILLTVLFVQVFLKGKLGRGLSNVLYSVSRKNGRVHKDKTYTHIITSALTVGFGGSAGLESPIVVTGSAIGSRIGTLLQLNDRERILLLACGTSAGVAAIFNSPIAGVIFAMEVLLIELTVSAFIPLLIASATATVISKLLYNRQLFHLITYGWEYESIPIYIVLGIACGMISAYITKTALFTEDWINAQKGIYSKALIGGLTLGLLIFLLPPLYGEGYSTIENLLNRNYDKLLDNSLFYQFNHLPWFILLFAGILILIKVVATSITIAAGGNGGIFATSMMTGALTGFFISFGLNLTGLVQIDETNFIAVGMAGILSGVIHAPLTAIFLIAEITGGYFLFVPLMIVAALSYFTSRYFESYTVYTKKLAEKGHLIHKDKDKTVLGHMDMKQILEKDFIRVLPHQSLEDIIPAIKESRRNVFPVVNADEKLLGILTLDRIKVFLFDQDKRKSILVSKLMNTEIPIVEIGEDMNSVIAKFEEHKVFNLAVTEGGKYKGFISKANIFSIYRNLLIEESQPFTTI